MSVEAFLAGVAVDFCNYLQQLFVLTGTRSLPGNVEEDPGQHEARRQRELDTSREGWELVL